MELLHIDCLGHPLRLEASLAGWQQLFWNGELVSQRDAAAEHEGKFTHAFTLHLQNAVAKEETQALSTDKTELSNAQMQANEAIIQIQLETDLHWQPFQFRYTLVINGEQVCAGERNSKDIERQTPTVQSGVKEKPSLLGLGSLAFKLIKSAKFIKALFAAATLAAYSWLFSFQFAIAFVACLVIHEYGHIRAMQYFGMKTKGIYLIPFMGGLALSEDKINTRWQDVTISIMGPTFGLLLSIGLLIVYWITGSLFFAALANFNALINLINLLPILPLDGGHVVKSIGFSVNGKFGLIAMIVGSVLGIVGSYSLGLSFLALFMLIGTFEIVGEWKLRHFSHLLPLDRYGQIFSTVWYILTIASLVGIMWYFSHSGDPLLAAPMGILRG
ncbi:site-2 protease family protein [Undibacterium fentianense]|uniref:Peptidase M50 domain-containing protein n=1 Tax=Undibacterium fentianense TaxID=2828728 RepID=A0A941E1S6_9BURK|nr:site-2 protease family protein [Undibacterium fentianense]MBR7799672.1 hypothetical protein [Undibacterium fentianense]